MNVARTLDIPFLRMGDIVREFYQTSGAAEKGMTVGQLANSERELHGKDIWAKRAIERMSGNIFLVDGCRSLDEVESYRKLSDDVHIIAVHASPSDRYRRLVKRARDDAPCNIEEFDARDRREMNWGLGNLIALSDIMILNDSDLESFHDMAHRILKELK